jgi:hypothetical protein
MPEFMCYHSESGDDVIKRWYRGLPPAVQGAVVATVELLQHRPREYWRRKPYGTLRGRLCSGLGELRIEEPKGVHYRMLGFFDQCGTRFVMLYAFRKDHDPEYLVACPKAQERKSNVERDGTRSRRCQFPAPS